MPVTNLLLFVALLQTGPAEIGIQEFTHGDFAAARKHLEQAAPGTQTSLYLALTRAAMGECEAVAPALKQQYAGSAPDTKRLAGLALVQCHIAAKRFTDAAPVIAQLETEFPSDADVLYVAANFYMKAWNDAIYRLYQNAPASFRVDQLSAEVFESQGKLDEAIGEYRKAIVKNPQAVNLHYHLGRALLMRSHDAAALEEAIREFEAELKLNPADAVAEYQIAQILIAQQKPSDASAHFERAAQLRPDFPEALIAVAKLRSDAKQYDRAIALLERAVKLQPRAEAAHYNLMIAYRNAGRMADAQREKAELDKIQRPPEGEFTDFLKRLGEKAPPQ